MPTIGKNTIGGGVSGLPNAAQGVRLPLYFYTAIAGDTVNLFSWYGTGDGSTTLEVAVYSVTANLPDLRLAAAVTITPTAALQWHDSAALSQALVAGTTYTVAMRAQPAHQCSRTIIADTADSRDTVAALPATWSEDGTRRYEFSYFANVVSGAPPVTGIIYPCRAQLIT